MLDIEIEGLELLLSAIRHPAFDGNPLARQLFMGCTREWAARQAGEVGPETKPLIYDEANEKEIKVVAGLMYGLSQCEELRPYWKTLALCVAILKLCTDELETRSAVGQPIQ